LQIQSTAAGVELSETNADEDAMNFDVFGVFHIKFDQIYKIHSGCCFFCRYHVFLDRKL